VLIDRASGAAKMGCGVWNIGTITVAELMPYIELMVWYTAKDGPGRRRRSEVAAAGRHMQIHIVTDSSTIAKCGNNPGSRRAHSELWACMDAYERSGYQMTYHHLHRERANLNVLVDQISRRCRLDNKEILERSITDLRKKFPGIPDNATIYDFF
jgi:hypothetical protein